MALQYFDGQLYDTGLFGNDWTQTNPTWNDTDISGYGGVNYNQAYRDSLLQNLYKSSIEGERPEALTYDKIAAEKEASKAKFIEDYVTPFVNPYDGKTYQGKVAAQEHMPRGDSTFGSAFSGLTTGLMDNALGDLHRNVASDSLDVLAPDLSSYLTDGYLGHAAGVLNTERENLQGFVSGDQSVGETLGGTYLDNIAVAVATGGNPYAVGAYTSAEGKYAKDQSDFDALRAGATAAGTTYAAGELGDYMNTPNNVGSTTSEVPVESTINTTVGTGTTQTPTSLESAYGYTPSTANTEYAKVAGVGGVSPKTASSAGGTSSSTIPSLNNPAGWGIGLGALYGAYQSGENASNANKNTANIANAISRNNAYYDTKLQESYDSPLGYLGTNEGQALSRNAYNSTMAGASAAGLRLNPVQTRMSLNDALFKNVDQYRNTLNKQRYDYSGALNANRDMYTAAQNATNDTTGAIGTGAALAANTNWNQLGTSFNNNTNNWFSNSNNNNQWGP